MTGKKLAEFMQSPGFSAEQLQTALDVIRALEPCMPDAWDSEGGTNLIEVLSHLVEHAPLSPDMERFIHSDNR